MTSISIESLQDLFIIPRTPSPAPPEDRPLEQLNREELIELLRRREVCSTSLPPLNTRHKGPLYSYTKPIVPQTSASNLPTPNKSSPKIKRERSESTPPSRSYKIVKTEKRHEVVDLTVEDDATEAPPHLALAIRPRIAATMDFFDS
jgi:hypothetical protein